MTPSIRTKEPTRIASHGKDRHRPPRVQTHWTPLRVPDGAKARPTQESGSRYRRVRAETENGRRSDSSVRGRRSWGSGCRTPGSRTRGRWTSRGGTCPTQCTHVPWAGTDRCCLERSRHRVPRVRVVSQTEVEPRGRPGTDVPWRETRLRLVRETRGSRRPVWTRSRSGDTRSDPGTEARRPRST